MELLQQQRGSVPFTPVDQFLCLPENRPLFHKLKMWVSRKHEVLRFQSAQKTLFNLPSFSTKKLEWQSTRNLTAVINAYIKELSTTIFEAEQTIITNDSPAIWIDDTRLKFICISRGLVAQAHALGKELQLYPASMFLTTSYQPMRFVQSIPYDADGIRTCQQILQTWQDDQTDHDAEAVHSKIRSLVLESLSQT